MEAEKVKLNETIKALRDEALCLIDSIQKTMRHLKTMVHNPVIDEGKRRVILENLESMVHYLDPENSESLQNQVERLVWYQNFWTWASINHQNHSKKDLSYEEKMVDEKIKWEIKKLAQMRLNQINPTLMIQAQHRLSSVEELLKRARQEIIDNRHQSSEINSDNSTNGIPSQSTEFTKLRIII